MTRLYRLTYHLSFVSYTVPIWVLPIGPVTKTQERHGHKFAVPKSKYLVPCLAVIRLPSLFGTQQTSFFFGSRRHFCGEQSLEHESCGPGWGSASVLLSWVPYGGDHHERSNYLSQARCRTTVPMSFFEARKCSLCRQGTTQTVEDTESEDGCSGCVFGSS